MKTLHSVNPVTGKMLKKFRELTNAELEKKLASASRAFATWRVTPMKKRAALMRKAARHLRKEKSKLAKIITLEVGKTLKASATEVEKCAWVLEYYADNAETMIAPERIKTESRESYVRFDPLGPVLAVMPWNFPFWQVFRFAAPALMAGNVGLLKHAANVQMSAIAIEQMFKAAGFPPGVFQNLPISPSRVKRVIEDGRVAAVTLTGSERAGSAVAEISGRELKKVVLELGGSDPFIVFKDSDLEAACSAAVSGRILNNAGQSCIAAKRFIVDRRIAAAFTEGIKKRVQKLVVGSPADPRTDIGPLATLKMVEMINHQVKESVKKGAKVIYGGRRIPGKGFFYEPAILTNVRKGMPAFDEELFGPVMPVITFRNEKEAIRLANDTQYGLGATIFTKDIKKAKRLAEHIDAGAVFINAPVKSDPRLPFGGIKKSGYGRELGVYGIKEFVNIKTVSIS